MVFESNIEECNAFCDISNQAQQWLVFFYQSDKHIQQTLTLTEVKPKPRNM